MLQISNKSQHSKLHYRLFAMKWKMKQKVKWIDKGESDISNITLPFFHSIIITQYTKVNILKPLCSWTLETLKTSQLSSLAHVYSPWAGQPIFRATTKLDKIKPLDTNPTIYNIIAIAIVKSHWWRHNHIRIQQVLNHDYH